jgi:hypothetical protein
LLPSVESVSGSVEAMRRPAVSYVNERLVWRLESTVAVVRSAMLVVLARVIAVTASSAR